MKALLPNRPCLLGCGWPDDDLRHYVCCSCYWEFLCKQRPRGLGISGLKGCKEVALGLSKEIEDDDVVRLAIGLYALFRTVNTLRFSPAAPHCTDPTVLLRMFAKRALDSHPSRKLLCWN